MSLKYDHVKEMTIREFARKIIPIAKGVPKQNKKDVIAWLMDLKGQLGDSDEERFNNLKEIFK